MYVSGKKINKIPVGGEDQLNGLKANEIRVIEKFVYDGKRTEFLILNNKSVVVIHNNYQRIIMPLNLVGAFCDEISQLKELLK